MVNVGQGCNQCCAGILLLYNIWIVCLENSNLFTDNVWGYIFTTLHFCIWVWVKQKCKIFVELGKGWSTQSYIPIFRVKMGVCFLRLPSLIINKLFILKKNRPNPMGFFGQLLRASCLFHFMYEKSSNNLLQTQNPKL